MERLPLILCSSHYLAGKALYLSTDTSLCNKLWKNSLGESAIRAGEEHSDSEHAVWSWQGNKWKERRVRVFSQKMCPTWPPGVPGLLLGNFALSCFLQLINIQPHESSSERLCFNHGIVLHPNRVTLTLKSFWVLYFADKSEKQRWHLWGFRKSLKLGIPSSGKALKPSWGPRRTLEFWKELFHL